MATLADIRRHPVKGLGDEALASVSLSAGAPLPFDRFWAVAHGQSGFDPAAPDWRPCRETMRVSLEPDMAQARTRYDEATGRMTLSHPDLGEVEADPKTEGAKFCDWLAPLAGKKADGPYSLISAAPEALVDVREAHVSVASLSSLRALSDMAGVDLDMRRFRMNLWLDDLAPWEELDWVGREVSVGAARLRIIDRDERCIATHANPESGARDVEVTKVLYDRLGHMDFGLYAQVVADGDVAIGDVVSAGQVAS
ncbi:MAG: MOSC domain-containing protein [Pseudomonadota bacterium]